MELLVRLTGHNMRHGMGGRNLVIPPEASHLFHQVLGPRNVHTKGGRLYPEPILVQGFYIQFYGFEISPNLFLA